MLLRSEALSHLSQDVPCLGQFLWLLMEYCAHGTLTARITKGIDVDSVRETWTEQLFLGLQHMHGLRVIHRDIKTVRFPPTRRHRLFFVMQCRLKKVPFLPYRTT